MTMETEGQALDLSGIDTVLLDLDGTLIPMEQQSFLDAYFADLARFVAGYGYRDVRALLDALMRGVGAMIQNDGGATNRERFWDAFSAVLGRQVRELEPALLGFYRHEFDAVRRVHGPAHAVSGHKPAVPAGCGGDAARLDRPDAGGLCRHHHL